MTADTSVEQHADRLLLRRCSSWRSSCCWSTAPALWLLPLLGAIAAIVVAKAAAHGLANAGLTVSTLSADILIVLVLGAACDYALLLIHRYREELRHHAAAEDAMAAALRRTLPTLVASAGTVICAMLCLLAAQSASLHGLGPVGAVAIVSALLAQTTFLPALLLSWGRAAFWPRVSAPGLRSARGVPNLGRIGTRVARHPAPVAAATVLLLGAACAGLARCTSTTIRSPTSRPTRQRHRRPTARRALPRGRHLPADLLTPPRQAGAAAAAARVTPGAGTVSPADGRGVRQLLGNPARPATAPAGAPRSRACAATRPRRARRARRRRPRHPVRQHPGGPPRVVLIPLVLLVIVIITPAAAGGRRPAGARRHDRDQFRRLVRAGQPAVATDSATPASKPVPLYIFIFLVALGVDYNIFLAARIREETRQAGLRQGTLRGLGVTGGVITAAGVVMAGTFAALSLLPTSPSPKSAPPSPSASCSTPCSSAPCSSPPPCSPSESASGGPHDRQARKQPQKNSLRKRRGDCNFNSSVSLSVVTACRCMSRWVIWDRMGLV